MSIQYKSIIRWSAALALALTLALLLTLSAHAQDEPPPPEAPAAPPAAPAAANPGAGDVTGQDPAPPPLAASDLQLYSGPDPWFYCSGPEPFGDPNPGNGKCEYPGDALDAAIGDFMWVGGSGLITCEDGNYSASPFIDGIPLLTGIVSVNGSGVTSIDGRVEVTNQASGFIFHGFEVGVAMDATYPLLSLHGNTGAIKLTDIVISHNLSGPALLVEGASGGVPHAGSVLLERVLANDNRATASRNYITRIIATGSITVNNSSFDHNLSPVDIGVVLALNSTTGKVSLNGVSASENDVGDGINILAKTGVTLKNLQLNHNGDSVVANSYGYGLWISSSTSGSVLIENITANGNEEAGLHIRTHGSVTIHNAEVTLNDRGGISVNNCYFDGTSCNPGGAYSVSLYNNYLFDNGMSGLVIESNGSILLDSVRVNDSGSMGATIYSNFATSAKPVTILRSEFNDTDTGIGLSILTRGKVTFKSVDASGSLAGAGAIIDNTYGSAGVVMLGTYGNNSYSKNHGKGLTISSHGSVSLRDVNASSNFSSGIDLASGFTLNVSLVNVGASLNGTGGAGAGIVVTNRGTITLRDVSCWANVNGEAIYLDNDVAAPTAFPGVSVTGVNVGNSQSGLVVYSRGPVTLVDIYAAGNTGPNGGILVDNCRGMPCIGKGGVTLQDIEVEQNTGGTGVFIQSGGAVSLTNAYSHTNHQDSLRVLNNQAIGTPGIVIKWGYFSTSATGSGANLETKGSVQLVNIVATGNADYGTYVYVNGNKPVSMSITSGGRNLFYNNGFYGLIVETMGAISVRAVTSSNPTGYDGIYLGNNAPGSTAGVTVRDVEVYSNHYRGLVVRTHGTINAAGIVADENDTASPSFEYAVVLDNCDYTGIACSYTGPARPVSLTAYGSIENAIYNNAKSGLIITTLGSITMCHTSSSNNPGSAGYGAFLEISNTAGMVTVSNSEFTGNGNTGLRIIVPGNVTLTDVQAGKNASAATGNGIWINMGGNLAMTRVNASGNKKTNIYVPYVGGSVTLRDVEASGSVDELGIQINNSAIAVKPVFMYRVTAVDNFKDNIYIISQGAITASGVNASTSKTGHGMFLKNTTGTAGITFNTTYGASSANGNVKNGMWLDTYGAITITGITASKNHEVGIQNAGVGSIAAAAATIKLTSVRAEGNWSDGVSMKTNTIPMRVTSSIMMGNSLNGIDVTFLGGAPLTNVLIVKSTLFAGNDQIGGGFSNIQVTNGIAVIQ